MRIIPLQPQISKVESAVGTINEQLAQDILQALNDSKLYTEEYTESAISAKVISDISGIDIQSDKGKLAAIETIFDVNTKVEEMFKGNIKDEDSYPQEPFKGNWVAINNCNITSPGNRGLGVYDGGGWVVIPFESGDINNEPKIPEPPDDSSKYFRSRESGTQTGIWIEFTALDGNAIRINSAVKNKSDANDDTYIPELGEFVYIQDMNNFTVGDGVKQLSELPMMFNSFSLNYTAEDISNKGQPDGYVPLNENLKIDKMYLPEILTDTYSQSEIDGLITALNTAISLTINTEIGRLNASDNEIISDIEEHIENTSIHVSVTEKDSWDNKLDNSDLLPLQNHLTDTDVHVTEIDKNRWDRQVTAYIAQSQAEMNAINTDDLTFGDACFLKISASGVTPVVYKKYYWYEGDGWNEDTQVTTVVNIAWGTISGRPSSTSLSIDNAVTVSHTHNNRSMIDKIGESPNGVMTYNNIPIGATVKFLPDVSILPPTGTPEMLYVILKDSRLNNYPSISVWDNNRYEILGRGINDAPTPVGDMIMQQWEMFGVVAPSEVVISLTRNDSFCFMPIEVLKLVAGNKDVVRQYTDFKDGTKFSYNSNLLKFDSTGLTAQSIELPMVLDTVSDMYYYSLNVDTRDYQNVMGVY